MVEDKCDMERESEDGGDREGCSFEWDETCHLYYHASSGFYHDPSAGWYYNRRDGLYYKFEDGNYVPVGYVEGDQCEMYDNVSNDPNTSTQDDIDTIGEHVDSLCREKTETQRLVLVTDDYPIVDTESSSQISEFLPPPSAWLEDTLIDLYLSGHSNREIKAADEAEMPAETDHDDALGMSWDEENWCAQYGQVVPSDEEPHPKIYAIDLWDWALVKEEKRKQKRQVAHLVGRLVRESAKLHPSVPSMGHLLKTAPICEVHLDLVRVRSGKVYKLRTTSAKYLASLSTYDSSNPTKDWGFPDISFDMQIQASHELSDNSGVKSIKRGLVINSTMLPDKDEGGAYRDRAAERRALHGGFGVGPGQKKSANGDGDFEPSYTTCPEEAAGEALNISFGAGSYARKLLKNMGWKEGEALGSSSKGLIEPLKAAGNKGNAGLGWVRMEQGMSKVETEQSPNWFMVSVDYKNRCTYITTHWMQPLSGEFYDC